MFRNEYALNQKTFLRHHQCSAQGQVLHCKLTHQDSNSAQSQVFYCKLRNLGCSFTRMNRCGSFPLLSAPHSLFSIWANIKRSEKISGAQTRRLVEWIWLRGPSGLHRNSPLGLNITSIIFLTRSEIRKSQSPFAPTYSVVKLNWTKCWCLNNWKKQRYNIQMHIIIWEDLCPLICSVFSKWRYSSN